jgi:hypothetical protein
MRAPQAARTVVAAVKIIRERRHSAGSWTVHGLHYCENKERAKAYAFKRSGSGAEARNCRPFNRLNANPIDFHETNPNSLRRYSDFGFSKPCAGR